MKLPTYLYIYYNAKLNSIYVGIGDDMGRVWGPHNPEAESLRDAPGTLILQTPEPFESRDDALKAEAIAIQIAALKGLDVVSPDTEGLAEEDAQELERLRTVNRAGAISSKWLAPAVLRREGEVDGTALERTVVVSVTPRQIDERPSPSGYLGGAMFSTRAAKWWNVAAEKQPQLSRLIAILSGSGGVILGSWKIDPEGDWADPDGGVIPLANPDEDNFGDIKGMRLTGIRANSGPVYSHDLRS